MPGRLKKNAPGCGCCGNVLVWDMGIHSENIGFAYDGTVNFLNWSTTETWLIGDKLAADESDKRGAGAQRVDYALGSALPDGNFWFPGEPHWEENTGHGCLQLPESFEQFDPNTDAVDLDYWSGNVYDYKLILWRSPFSTETLWHDYLEDLGGDCLDDINGCQAIFGAADNRHIFGGLPDWWQEVSEGKWQGRVVILLPGEETPAFNARAPSTDTDLFSGTRTMTALFINTFSDITGLELDVSQRRTNRRLASCENVFEPLSGDPGLEDLTSSSCENAPQDEFAEQAASGLDTEDPSNIMLDVEGLYGVGFIHNIDGGEAMAVQTSAFRDFCEEDDLEIDIDPNPFPTPDVWTYTYTVPEVTEVEQVTVARNVLTKTVDETDYKVEFVLCHDWHVTDPQEVTDDTDAPAFTEFHKQFVRNLFIKPLMPDGSVQS